MGVHSTPRASISAYAARPVTKAPDWHGLVRMDLLFNNLSTGLFLVAALGELVAPASFRPLAPVAYPIALLFLVADLVCLVLDLGDPSRFHHMLRVWKPSSPMSLGTWFLTAYAAPLTALSLLSLLPGGGVLEAVRRTILVVGLAPAVATAVYKGVLFSTTAQRGWRDARWLGGYLINAALVLGAAEALLLAIVMGQPRAMIALRLALRLLLLLNLLGLALLLVDLRDALSGARRIGGRGRQTPPTAVARAGRPYSLGARGATHPLGRCGCPQRAGRSAASSGTAKPRRLSHTLPTYRRERAPIGLSLSVMTCSFQYAPLQSPG